MTKLVNILDSEGVLLVLILGSVFSAMFLLAHALIPDEAQIAARRRLGVEDDEERPGKVSLLRWLRPLYKSMVPLIYADLVPSSVGNYFDGFRNRIQPKLISANLRDEISPDEFIGFKFLMTFLIPLLVVYLGGTLGFSIPSLLWPLIAAAGYYFPDGWLYERIKLRRKAIVRDLPYTLDLITLSVEAGLDFIASIQRLTERTQENALMIELGHMLREIRLGTSRADALRSLSDRLRIEEITSLTTLLIQVDQLGASVGQVLRAQSDQLRAARFQAAEAAGARASQLILVPLVFFIFPSIFIVFLGPVILNFLMKGLY